MFALDLLNQFQSYNGSLLAAGKIYVYNLGRTQLAPVYGDHNGATPIANPVVLDDQGMAEIYLNDAFNYTIVVYDAYGQEQFSRDIYPRGMGNGETIGTQLYEGVDPIVVNNDLYAISANTTKLGVQEPLYFVQDDAERVVIGFSGEEIPTGTMNESALGYQDGKITGYNGSAFSAGNTYEEGSYISIDGNTISVTGLTPVPADTASTGLVASVSADITGMIPDTSDMATQTWVNEQGFLTAHQDLSAYAKTEDLTAYQEKGNYYSASNPSGFINSDSISAMATTGFVAGVSADITAMIPDTSDMATKTWVTGQGYLTAHQSLDGLMSADLLEISDNKITGYNGTAFAGQGGGGVTGDFALVEGNGIQLTDDPTAQTTTISVSGDYATNTQLQSVSADITAMIPTALTGDYLDKASADTLYYPLNSNPNNYLTGLPQDLVYTADIADMATTGDLTGKQDITGMTAYATVESLTAKQDAGNYLSASDSANFLLTSDSDNFYPSDNPSAFITGVDLTPYQLTADMVNYQTTAGMTAYQEAGDYYSASNPSGFISEVPDTYLQNTDLSTEDGKVTAISGIPLSAGGDVPEGVMVESGLEYNAVNEISGYNGSAIAQYGAEKQWLVHDDTLVHVANSAQYALGVNLSAISADLARMMGVDETVLWEGPVGSFTGFEQTAHLNDSITNFKEVALYNYMDGQISKSQVSAGNGYACFFWNYVWYPERSDCNYRLCWTVLHFSGDVVKTYKAKMMYTTSESTTWSNFYNNEWSYKPIVKIIGIGRKQ